MRSSSALFCGPRSLSSAMSIGSISASFAISIAFSAVPPMPMPSIPGGHQPAPMVGTVLSTQSANGVRRVEHGELRFRLRTAAFGGDVDLHLVTGHELYLDDGRRVVARVLAAV